MPPAVYSRDSPQYKCQLLRYILAIKDEFRDREPDYVNFFNWVGKSFEYAGVPPFERPDELSSFLDQEVHKWTREVDNSPRKRRAGHEKGSEYDSLMRTFTTALDAITVDHWHWVVTQAGPNYKKYTEVPVDYRAKVRTLVTRFGNRDVKAGDARAAAAHAAKMFHASQTERHDFEYDAVKLERVVNAAMMRAREVGKPDLADSVHLLYLDSLKNMDLRVLLEKTLTQKCTDEETREFQDYVRKAKRRLKTERLAKASGSQTQSQSTQSAPSSVRSQRVRVVDVDPGQSTSQSSTTMAPPSSAPRHDRASRAKTASQPPTPKVVVSKTEEDEAKGVSLGAMKPPSYNARDRLEKHHATEDSGYGSEQTGDKAESSTKGTTPSENGSAKRRAESVTSSQAAEQEDLEDARERRASKRRKRADSDDSGSYHPSMDTSRRSRPAKKGKTEGPGRVSRDSSPLSEPPDEDDIEQAKEAYVDEMVRRKSAEASRQAIEDKYGPVSPSLIGDTRSEPAESWASMPSPTMEPTRPAAAARSVEQATAGARNSQKQPHPAPPTQIPGPPPEGFTPDEGANAYKLITATVAEAILPYFKHMETKLGKIEDQQKSIAKTAMEQTLPSSKELMDAAKALQSHAVQGGSPETTQLISQLLKNAAEASIHAAEAARKAGEVARDVSNVLIQISSNGENGTTSQTPQRRKRKS